MTNHRKLLGKACSLFLAFLILTGCSSPVPFGTIDGHLVSANSGIPLKKTQLILCLLSDKGDANILCTLQGTPTVLSDTDGGFHLSDVPIGSYALVYGFSDELKLTSDQWGGLKVTKGESCMKGGKNAVCRSPKDENAFWSSGGTFLGENNFIKGTQDFDTEANNAAIAFKYTQGNGGLYLFSGAVRSNYTGISIMVLIGELAPVVQVKSGKITNIEWRVNGQ